jgi:hypothetical protein
LARRAALEVQDELGTTGPDGRLRARLWVALGTGRDPVTVASWPTPAQVRELLGR